MVAAINHIEDPKINAILRGVSDPEIPVLSIMDMGVVRSVERVGENELLIKITPTYSGCPAMDTIATDIMLALGAEGYKAKVELILSPAWTTDWITEHGRKQLKEYGIAPPESESLDKAALIDGKRVVECPQCKSKNTEMVSQFGSTACKALFKCLDCLEPFDYFKCLK